MEEKTSPKSFQVDAEEECESSGSQAINTGLLDEMRSSQNENFARLEGVLTGSFLGLQKTLSELLLPLNNSLKRACSESDDVASLFFIKRLDFG